MSGFVGRSIGVWGFVLSLAGVASAQTTPPGSTTAFPPAGAQPAAPASSAAPAAAAASECFPACRSGFTCHVGQCVSLCNPPCAAGESCTANGECAAVSRAAPDLDDEEEEEEEARPRRRRELVSDTDSSGPSTLLRSRGQFVFAIRAGFGVIGSGTGEASCSGCLTAGPTSSKSNVIDKSPFMLGVDAMMHASRGLRLGAGYQLVPYSAVAPESDKSDSVHLGHEHALRAIVEGIVPLGPNIGFVLRAQGGLRMLVIGGELTEKSDAFLADCKTLNDAHCEVDQGALFGSSIGAMVGLLGGKKVHWRVDLALDRDNQKLPSRTTVSGQPSREVTRDSSFGMTRFWVLGGIEL